MKRIVFTLYILGSLTARAQVISTVAGNGTWSYSGDGGPAVLAELNNPNDVTVDKTGNFYIADTYNNRVRKVDTLGNIITIAGTGATGSGGDGGPAIAAQLTPTGLDFDTSGNLYIADPVNGRIRIINTSGIITTVAGTGGTGYSGDGSPAVAATFNGPSDVACDHNGNFYIADTYNNRVRKVNAAGIISTIAGNGAFGYSGDGVPATAAAVSEPRGVAVDHAGNVYISEYGDSRIRKVSVSGIISTFAGTGIAGYDGDGTPATNFQLSQPMHIRFDTSDNLFVADYGNSLVRKITPAGAMIGVAGNGTYLYSGDGGAAALAGLDQPAGIGIGYNCSENVYIADALDSRIRLVTQDHPPVFTMGDSQSISYCFASAPYTIDTLLRISDLDTGQEEVWSVVFQPTHGTVVASYGALSTGGVITPLGLSYTPFAGYFGVDSFRVRATDCDHASAVYTTVYTAIDSFPVADGITPSEDITVCVDQTTTLADAATGGIWIAANSNATVVGGVITGASAGADSIIYAVTNACGTASAGIPILVNPQPASISGPENICTTSTAAYTDLTPGGVWQSSTTSIATVNGVTGIVQGLSAGSATITYILTATGCYNTKSINVQTPPCALEVPLENHNEQLLISPNPATGQLTIQVGEGAYDLVAIMNNLGLVVLTQQIAGEQTRVNVAALPAGVYYIRLTGEHDARTERFVKE